MTEHNSTISALKACLCKGPLSSCSTAHSSPAPAASVPCYHHAPSPPPLQIRRPQRCAYLVRKGEENIDNRHRLKQCCNQSERGVGGNLLLNKLVALRCRPPSELEVACVGGWPGTAALENDEDEGSDDGDEVEGKVHDIADYGGWGELLEGTLSDCESWLVW